jgi:hypothetical protein
MDKRWRILVLFGFLTVFIASLTWSFGEPQDRSTLLKAGFSKIDITPAEPVTMSGYASRRDLSKGIHDPLSARAIAFQASQKRLVLVSTDVLGFYGDTAAEIRKVLLKTYSLDPSELFLTSIHTHAGPTVTLDDSRAHPNNIRYTKQLTSKLVELAGVAIQNLKPVGLSYATGSSPVGVNRREIQYSEDHSNPRVRLGRNPNGIHDKEVQVLKIVSDDGSSAILFNYATHSTSLGPQNYQISGDVHGLAEQFIERNLGGNTIAPAMVGASGDIDPWYRILPGFETENGWIPETMLLGTMLGEEVIHALRSNLKPIGSDLFIKTAFRTVLLPGRDKEDLNEDAAEVPINITAARIGPVAFIGLGGEALTDIGLAIKQASPFEHTMVITHCNGASGYVVPDYLYIEGGYEVETTKFSPAAAGKLIREAVEMLNLIKLPAGVI